MQLVGYFLPIIYTGVETRFCGCSGKKSLSKTGNKQNKDVKCILTLKYFGRLWLHAQFSSILLPTLHVYQMMIKIPITSYISKNNIVPELNHCMYRIINYLCIVSHGIFFLVNKIKFTSILCIFIV